MLKQNDRTNATYTQDVIQKDDHNRISRHLKVILV